MNSSKKNSLGHTPWLFVLNDFVCMGLTVKIKNSKGSVWCENFRFFIVLWCLAVLNDYFGGNKGIEGNWQRMWYKRDIKVNVFHVFFFNNRMAPTRKYKFSKSLQLQFPMFKKSSDLHSAECLNASKL
jgi:hypothetical protein